MSNSVRFIVLLFVFLFAMTYLGAAQTCPCSIWNSDSAPGLADSGDNGSVELGVKFRADADGYIIGLRFYKSTANIGPHIGHLWTTNGTLLASATFVNETSSGWQEVVLPAPVQVFTGVTYIASYFSPKGHYSMDLNAFTYAGVDSAPLHALMEGVDGSNGVYTYGPSSSFPSSTYQSPNYWVDVVYVTNTTVPAVKSVFPGSGSTGVDLGATLRVAFNVPIDPLSLSASALSLRDSANNVVSGSVTYESATATAVFTPNMALQPGTVYTATLQGSVSSVIGTTLGADYSWSFTSAPPPPNSGPGGPILVISSARNPFSRYIGEILLAEGLNEFTVQDISTVTADTLSNYDIAILGDFQLTSNQAAFLTSWVNSGGNLIAMRPDKQLAGLLGLTSTPGTLANAYLQVNTASVPGFGIVDQTIQFHGTADLYTLPLNGASTIATLFSDSTTATGSPAVTLASAGNGQAAAFTYDLARSIVYTRQGNPAWVGVQRIPYNDGTCPGCDTTIIRAADMFFGDAPFDPQPDWIDFNKIQIPQADEQQRLLVNLIELMNRNKKPLPRFWYLPGDYKAAVIMTGDDHNIGGTSGRFDQYIADSPDGCSVADWTCVRATSYVYPDTPVFNYQSYVSDGFEIANHGDNVTSCTNFTFDSLDSAITAQLAQMAQNYPGLPASKTNRTHCVVWSDWDSGPKVLLKHGIRLDTSYYYWPQQWILDRPGMFTGSGMPMRFADSTGEPIDVYQATTQMPDESLLPFPDTINALLDNAIGVKGYYGVFTANMHTDQVDSAGSDAIVTSAQARGVPIISSLQMLTWLDGKDSSSFGSLSWAANKLSFTITQGTGAHNLRAMLPTNANGVTLQSLTRDGAQVNYTTDVVKGIQYAVFPADSGSYTASYYAGTTYSITGKIDGAGGNGATVRLSGGATVSTTADASGNFSFSGLTDGGYTVTVTKTGYTFTPASAAVNLSGSNQTVSFTSAAVVQTYTISGTISGAGGNGATVALTGASTANTTADASGKFSFSGLSDGSYTVTVTKTGYTFTPASAPVTLSGSNQTVSFASLYTISGTISGSGGNGATVALSGASTASTTADASGKFSFSGLSDGSYTVTVTKTGYTFTPASAPVTLSGGNQTVSFASLYTISGSISGAGGNGATVALSGASTANTTADASGKFSFSGLSDGSYTVTVTKTGYTFTPASAPVTLSGSNQTVSFASLYTISGSISGAGGNGATVALSGASTANTTADASGKFSFSGLSDGSYTVTVTKTGYTFTPASAPVTLSGSNQTVSFASLYTISGSISGAGGNGATVALSGTSTANTTADASGKFSFSGLSDGSYTVTVTKTGYTFTPASAPVTLSGSNQTVSFASLYTISGTISGSGGNGATVALSGASTASTTADASGNFSFSGLSDGSYTVTVTKTGYTFTPASAPVTLSGGNQTVSFASLYTISGSISGAGGNGATVALSGASTANTTADASGKFSFSGLSDGSYTVTVTRTGYTFTPASAPVTLSGSNQTVSFASLYTISGSISGAGGNGATVALSGTSTASTTADASGNFSFSGLSDGSYTVTVTRTGYTFTPASAPVTLSGSNQTVSFTSAVVPPDFSPELSVETATVNAGQSASVVVTIKTASGFSSAVVLTCSGLPVGATCGFSPASVTPSSQGATSTLTITTTPRSLASARNPGFVFAIPVFGMLLVGTLRKRQRIVAFLVLAIASLTLIGCGGGTSTVAPPPTGGGGTPAGTYVVNITASGGGVEHKKTFSLTVR